MRLDSVHVYNETGICSTSWEADIVSPTEEATTKSVIGSGKKCTVEGANSEALIMLFDEHYLAWKSY